MMHFPLFQIFPLFSRNFLTLWKIFQILPFPKNSRFSFTKISEDLFLVINHKFLISPLFSLFHYISPTASRKLLFPPTLKNFPSVLDKSSAFYILYTYFVSPLL